MPRLFLRSELRRPGLSLYVVDAICILMVFRPFPRHETNPETIPIARPKIGSRSFPCLVRGQSHGYFTKGLHENGEMCRPADGHPTLIYLGFFCHYAHR